jgi:precorrin-4/cobalt-precorrin-4 C11-methyltransferase
MTVHFVGAGPGAPDLLTLRGRDRIAACPVCLYAGSLVPEEVIAHAPADARVVNTAPLTLDEIMAEIEQAHAAGQDVARLHSGDLSVYSAMGEQVRRLEEMGIDYTITPGVPAFSAASATLGRELTVPEVAQSVVLTRTQGRASSMPCTETLEAFAESRATLAVHLSLHTIEDVVARLTPYYGADCPVAVVLRASWPDETVLTGRLDTIAQQAAELEMRRTALILVGPALAPGDFRDSALYDPDHVRRFRGQEGT